MLNSKWIYTTSKKYIDNGITKIHKIKALVEVTEVYTMRCEFKTIKILEETGIPSWSSNSHNMKGGFSTDPKVLEFMSKNGMLVKA